MDSIHTSTTHFLEIHLNIILPFHLGLPRGLYPSGFPIKTLYVSLLSPIHADAPPNSLFSIWLPGQYWVRSMDHCTSLCRFFHSPVPLSPLGPNILLSTLFSHTLSLCSSLNVSDQVSRPYTTCKIIVLYILILKFLDSKLEDKRFSSEWQQAFPEFNIQCVPISSWIELWFVKVVPKYLNSSNFSKKLLLIYILWFRPAFWSWEMTMYSVLSAFTSSPISLLPTNKIVFFFMACMLPSNIVTSSELTKSRCTPFNFKPSWFTWTLLMAYLKQSWKSTVIKQLLVSNHS